MWLNIREKKIEPLTIKKSTKDLLRRVAKKSRLIDAEASDELQDEGKKIIIAFKIIDIWTRLEVFLRRKLSGHTIILTQASNKIDEL